MGTFHDGKGDLHGITVVVSTRASEIWIGRCDTVTSEEVVLLGAHVYSDVSEARSRALSGAGSRNAQAKLDRNEWIRRAALVGVHPRHGRVVLPRAEVLDIERLGDMSVGA